MGEGVRGSGVGPKWITQGDPLSPEMDPRGWAVAAVYAAPPALVPSRASHTGSCWFAGVRRTSLGVVRCGVVRMAK